MENERIIRIEENSKNTMSRIENLESKIDEICKLNILVSELSLEIKEMREDINKVEKRITIIEEKPAKRWNNLVTQIISLGVAGIIGYLLSSLGL
jgi:SMC interacting uncharacterized protein involved in chromosome segregation